MPFIFVWTISLFVLLFSCSTPPEEPVERMIPTIDFESICTDLNDKCIEQKRHELDSIFTRLHKYHGFNGSVLYAEKGWMIYKNAFGIADYRKKDSLRTNSKYQLASVSKMFTATAVMILYEKGLVEYDSTLAYYIPEFPYKEVTVRQLLTHRSGLSRYMTLAHDQWDNKRMPLTNTAMMELFVEHQPDPYFSADGGFHYCNTNYALLANLVEAVSGMPFYEFAEKEIFEPLGMTNTEVYHMNGDSLVPYRVPIGVPGYNYRGWRLIRAQDDYLNGVYGDKGVFSTVEDMYKFDRALYDSTFLKHETVQEAYKKGSPKYWKRKDNYGFGWRIKTSEDSAVYHYGWWKGFRAFFIRDLKSEKCLIVLSNRAKGPGSTRLWDIIRKEDLELGNYTALP